MIITPHMLVGAAIGSQSPNLWLALGGGLVSHYLLDFLPHWDYLDKVTTKSSDLRKVGLDFIIGVIVVLILSWSYPQKIIIIVAVLAAILPDFLVFLYQNFNFKWLRPLYWFHHKIHFWKRLSFWQGLPATLVVVSAAILVLLL